MSEALKSTLAELNRIRQAAATIGLIVRFVRAALLMCVMFSLWSLIQPEHEWEKYVLAVIAFALGLFLHVRKHASKIHEGDLLMALDMEYAEDTLHSPFQLRDAYLTQAIQREWSPRLGRYVADQKRFERGWLWREILTLPLPLICLVSILVLSPGVITGAIENVSSVVVHLTSSATLKVLEGASSPKDKSSFSLKSGRTAKIDLMGKNMVEITVVAGKDDQTPHVELRRKGSSASGDGVDLLQSFQLARGKTGGDEQGESATLTYSLLFAIEEDADLYLSAVSKSDPVATVTVRRVPVPKVHLELSTSVTDAWPDDMPLGLQVDVNAEAPLEWVRLSIKTPERTQTELVANVVAADKKSLTTDYELVLESYLDEDIETVEIVAQALDRSLPMPLLGESSPPVIIQVASAYGRYRLTLRTLSDIRGMLDEAVGQSPLKVDAKATELSAKARQQANQSPYFDGLDRFQINQFLNQLADLQRQPTTDQLIEVSGNLGRFLFEHEVLDDQERDRDFFVAARTLSRLLEEPREKRGVAIASVTERIKTFLDERYQRWVLRVERLGENFVPTLWPEIKKRSFWQDMETITRLDQLKGNTGSREALAVLSQSVSLYRRWIEELANLEEKARQKRESERQQGLADARNILKLIQKTQEGVSKGLYKADERRSEVEKAWPTVRMDQNNNIKAASSLELKLRALSPTAGDRIAYAVKSMKMVVDRGQEDEFVVAESASDMAARLLHQAESAARKAQQQEERQRGSRRRVSGDKYYGNQVIGGQVEIRHEYEVSRMYREDILDDVQKFREQHPDNRQYDGLLDDYLRAIVR